MVKPNEVPADEQSLRKLLHEKIDSMNGEGLSFLNRVLMQLEVERLSEELDDAFDSDRAEGKLSHEKIQEAIARHRAHHPYR